MKLVIPYTGTPHEADTRLIRLAEFLGINCQLLHLAEDTVQYAAFIEAARDDQGRCLVVNSRVLGQWTHGVLPAELVPSLLSSFRYLFVYGLAPDHFSQVLMKALSGGHLQSVQPLAHSDDLYEISSDARDVCGPFSGVSLGPINSDNDSVFSICAGRADARTLITIGTRPFMALLKRGGTEIFFMSGKDIVDMETEAWDVPLSDYFSRFLAPAIALRHVFRDESWQPSTPHASLIIDDPLLRPTYGYLRLSALLDMMKKHNFATTVAFIPHNYRRNSRRAVETFKQNRERLAISYHGNDHTPLEMASQDIARLNRLMRIARTRMRYHEAVTGLNCDNVMVFPQERFSVEAMKVLKACNFDAGVSSTPYPRGRRLPLPLTEFAQPALLCYGGFPLFLRRYICHLKKEEIAFNLFFGRPVLLVDHHEVFRRPDVLIEAVSTVNSIAPEVRWCGLEEAVMNSTLHRLCPDGSLRVRAYSATVRVVNDGESRRSYTVEWARCHDEPAIEQILQDGLSNHSFDVEKTTVRLKAEIDPNSSEIFSLAYRNDYPCLDRLGVRWTAKAILRRRVSEVRDNYISKNQVVLNLAKALQKRISRRS